MKIKEITTEYVVDEDGKLKIQKQKVQEKTIPPNIDLLKLIYSKNDDDNFSKLSDQELEQEKKRLLKELKESENGG